MCLVAVEAVTSAVAAYASPAPGGRGESKRRLPPGRWWLGWRNEREKGGGIGLGIAGERKAKDVGRFVRVESVGVERRAKWIVRVPWWGPWLPGRLGICPMPELDKLLRGGSLSPWPWPDSPGPLCACDVTDSGPPVWHSGSDPDSAATVRRGSCCRQGNFPPAVIASEARGSWTLVKMETLAMEPSKVSCFVEWSRASSRCPAAFYSRNLPSRPSSNTEVHVPLGGDPHDSAPSTHFRSNPAS